MSEFDIMVFFGIRALVALIAGFILGIERSLSNHYVGVKAIVFVCIGSCLFASLSFYLYSIYPHTDPTRIIGQAITGIGFLGAVLHNNTPKVSGLTSSAIIWTACGVGLMAGSGLFWVPIFAAITLVIITIGLKKLEKFLEKYEKDNTEEKKQNE